MVHVAERIAPDPAGVAMYDRAFAVYEELHARLAPANEALAALDSRGMSSVPGGATLPALPTP
jgi:hypothetical protein